MINCSAIAYQNLSNILFSLGNWLTELDIIEEGFENYRERFQNYGDKDLTSEGIERRKAVLQDNIDLIQDFLAGARDSCSMLAAHALVPNYPEGRAQLNSWVKAEEPNQDISGDQSRFTNRDYMTAHESGSALRGKKGRDNLNGGTGNDFLSGGKAQDTLNGASGNDRLQGGKQDDYLAGGTGTDTFVFRAAHGRDLIQDFAAGTDIIEIHGAEYSDLTIKKWHSRSGVEGSRIEWDEGTILVHRVERDTLRDPDNFEFV